MRDAPLYALRGGSQWALGNVSPGCSTLSMTCLIVCTPHLLSIDFAPYARLTDLLNDPPAIASRKLLVGGGAAEGVLESVTEAVKDLPAISDADLFLDVPAVPPAPCGMRSALVRGDCGEQPRC
jgi:hypothetical protein